MLKVDALSRLSNNIGSKVEFVMCGYEYLMDDSITYSTYGKQGTDNYDIYCRDEGIKHMFKNDYWSWFICSKMFKRDILVRNNILFDTNLYHGEDVAKTCLHLSSEDFQYALYMITITSMTDIRVS